MIRAFIRSQTRHINDYSQALHMGIGLWWLLQFVIYRSSLGMSLCLYLPIPYWLVNYECPKTKNECPKKGKWNKVGYITMFLFLSWWSTIIGLEIYYKNKMSVIWKGEEIQET